MVQTSQKRTPEGNGIPSGLKSILEFFELKSPLQWARAQGWTISDFRDSTVRDQYMRAYKEAYHQTLQAFDQLMKAEPSQAPSLIETVVRYGKGDLIPAAIRKALELKVTGLTESLAGLFYRTSD